MCDNETQIVEARVCKQAGKVLGKVSSQIYSKLIYVNFIFLLQIKQVQIYLFLVAWQNIQVIYSPRLFYENGR